MSAESDQIDDYLSYAGLGFGVVAAVAPGAFLRLYGLRGEETTRLFARMWGAAQIAVSAEGLRASTARERRDHLVTTAALGAGNMLAILAAGNEVGRGSKLLGLVTTAGFAGAAAYALRQD